MKTKNIFILLLILLMAFLGYYFYKNSKNGQKEQEVDQPTAMSKDPQKEVKDSEPMTKKEVKGIIEEELNENPDIIINALESHVNKQQNAHKQKVQQIIIDHKDQLLNNKDDPKYGNPRSKNTIVTFYDYNCGYCKKMSDVIKQVIDSKEDVYIVFKELPILGEQSMKASMLALAVNKIYPDKFLDFHIALMEDTSNLSLNQKATNICKTLNIDSNKLFKQADDPSIKSIIDQNFDIAKVIGFKSTPTLIVNDELIPGYVNYNQLISILGSNEEEEVNAESANIQEDKNDSDANSETNSDNDTNDENNKSPNDVVATNNTDNNQK